MITLFRAIIAYYRQPRKIQLCTKDDYHVFSENVLALLNKWLVKQNRLPISAYEYKRSPALRCFIRNMFTTPLFSEKYYEHELNLIVLNHLLKFPLIRIMCMYSISEFPYLKLLINGIPEANTITEIGGIRFVCKHVIPPIFKDNLKGSEYMEILSRISIHDTSVIDTFHSKVLSSLSFEDFAITDDMLLDSMISDNLIPINEDFLEYRSKLQQIVTLNADSYRIAIAGLLFHFKPDLFFTICPNTSKTIRKSIVDFLYDNVSPLNKGSGINDFYLPEKLKTVGRS